MYKHIHTRTRCAEQDKVYKPVQNKCAHVMCMARATRNIGYSLLVQGSKYTPRGLGANIHPSPQDVSPQTPQDLGGHSQPTYITDDLSRQ